MVIFMKFELVSKYNPSGDQPEAIKKLSDNINKGEKFQVLLGATGTGKTFTIANVIKNVNKKTLVLAHNKTLAGQLYAELKELFPKNKVEYFVSNFDFYQPEAYIPSSDKYIEKDLIIMLNTLYLIMIIINQKHMLQKRIHILKKMLQLMMKLMN